MIFTKLALALNDALYDFYDTELKDFIRRSGDDGFYYFDDNIHDPEKIGKFDDLVKWIKESYKYRVIEGTYMRNYKIKNATAIYTGGGIYIYYGELQNGLHFRTADEWLYISICDAETGKYDEDGFCDADFEEFYQEHEVDDVQGCDYENFFNDMILWILHNKPDGNYSTDELESRMYARIDTDIEIDNAQTLARLIQEETKQNKFDTMIRHQIESIKRCMAEYRDGCNFIFNDSAQYQRDFEKVWQTEFFNNAVRLFESKGYRIEERGNHTYITW